jgi:hypothetical protein
MELRIQHQVMGPYLRRRRGVAVRDRRHAPAGPTTSSGSRNVRAPVVARSAESVGHGCTHHDDFATGHPL